ncbi:MAG: Holliday junction resolvase RecU [Clostridia bacterium]|nr:Holliday junction resolvase RecU [Clostridia bacterium]
MYLKTKSSITNSKNRRTGASSESMLESMFDYQFKLGNMYIQKTPEPTKCIKNIGKGKFISIYTGKSQPDFKGTVKGGRCIIIESKHTTTGKIMMSCIDSSKNDEKMYLCNYETMGALCFVAVMFDYSNPCMIPFNHFISMKEIYGRKYMTKEECMKFVWNGYSDTVFYERINS